MKIFSFYTTTCFLMVFAVRANAKSISSELVDTKKDLDNERPPLTTIMKK